MPQKTWSNKRERQYEHVKESEKKQGRSTRRANRIAARAEGGRALGSTWDRAPSRART